MNSENILELVDEIIKSEHSKKFILLKICELLKTEVDYYNWVGIYILDKEAQILKLGPYIGKPTDHTHIPIGKGVCGQVAASRQTMVVQDISKMVNYIACSLDVKSEIVVPVLKYDEFIAEIDIDSHSPAPFSEKDRLLLETIGEKIKHLF